jgi:predicted amidohydrolase YtcJ
MDAGATLAFGSDWTVAPIDPLLGLYAAVTRRTLDGANPAGWVPSEKLDVGQTLRAYTAAAAYAGFSEGLTGTLARGSMADVVILSQNPLAVDPVGLEAVHVDLTMVEGRISYERQ